MRARTLIPTLILIGLLGVAFAYTIAPQAPIAPTAEKSAESAVELSHNNTASVAAATSLPKLTSYTIPVVSAGTVIDAMRAYAETNASFTVSGHEFSGLGFFVDAINRVENTDGYYWTLFINGTLSEQGASAARVVPGDTVEWRYQKGV